MHRVHVTRLQARTELANAGFHNAFSTPGRPELWVKGRDRRAVQRRVIGADEAWLIVAYPEPAVCLPEQVASLYLRDGEVMQAGAIALLDSLAPETIAGSWLD